MGDVHPEGKQTKLVREGVLASPHTMKLMGTWLETLSEAAVLQAEGQSHQKETEERETEMATAGVGAKTNLCSQCTKRALRLLPKPNNCSDVYNAAILSVICGKHRICAT